MSRTIIDVYALQTVPPSNLNRDDTGSPKTAVYGGVRRARVSSQAWKRAIRLSFADLLDRSQLGERTKRVGSPSPHVSGRLTRACPRRLRPRWLPTLSWLAAWPRSTRRRAS
ncbi:hypothetical protein GCM10029963_74730 [Micromonospora andamanensis]